MADALLDLGYGFWSIRGRFRLRGLLDIGTQAGLVALPSGRFVLLDSYTLPPDVLKPVMALTDQGRAIEAILNLHPFHTVHCEAAHRQFPQARLHGTTRHQAKWPGLPWDAVTVDSQALADRYADVLDFSVPRGVDFISSNENVHFSSVLAHHRPSRTLYVDDTLTCFQLPFPLSLVPANGRLDFHPTLGSALKREPGAAQAFRDWATELGSRWTDTARVCAAHSRNLDLPPGRFPVALREALGRVEGTLQRHEQRAG